MQWFTEWWLSLDLLQQSFACVAVPATIVLILQTLLLIFGVGGHSADHGEIDTEQDFGAEQALDDAPDGAHHAAGVRVFTIRGFVALFAVGGWLGIAMIDVGVPAVGASLIAIVGGLAALLLVAWILKLCFGLQEDGNIRLKNAVAHTARVYIRIPPLRGGTGKVTLNLQDRFVELEAMTDAAEELKPESMVQVVSVVGDTLIVRPLSTNKN